MQAGVNTTTHRDMLALRQVLCMPDERIYELIMLILEQDVGITSFWRRPLLGEEVVGWAKSNNLLTRHQPSQAIKKALLAHALLLHKLPPWLERNKYVFFNDFELPESLRDVAKSIPEDSKCFHVRREDIARELANAATKYLKPA